ncbi:MAG: MoaD/ThiS family protein [Cellulophaga sp.]
MHLTIKYFGMLTEITQCDEETFAFTQNTVLELLNSLFIKYPLLKDKDFQVALNNELVPIESEISSTEIALLPPFAGG